MDSGRRAHTSEASVFAKFAGLKLLPTEHEALVECCLQVHGMQAESSKCRLHA